MGTTKLTRRFKQCRAYLAAHAIDDALALIADDERIGAILVDDECLFRMALWSGFSAFELNRLMLAGVSFDLPNSLGVTPLTIAASMGKLQIARQLIDWGARVNSANDECETPLSYACARNHYRIAALLLDNGADCNALIGKTLNSRPLDWAKLYGSKKLQRLLISHGAVSLSTS
jgi:ankyrin repeat protein